MHQDQLAGHARRRQHLGEIVKQDLGARIGFLQVRVLELHVLDQLGDLVGAVRFDDGLVVVAPHRGAAVAHLVIPDHLGAGLGDREGEAQHSALDVVGALEAGCGGVLDGRLVDLLGEEGAAYRRIHDHLVIRVLGEHRLLARGQVIGVLGQVVLGDDELRRFELAAAADLRALLGRQVRLVLGQLGDDAVDLLGDRRVVGDGEAVEILEQRIEVSGALDAHLLELLAQGFERGRCLALDGVVEVLVADPCGDGAVAVARRCGADRGQVLAEPGRVGGCRCGISRRG